MNQELIFPHYSEIKFVVNFHRSWWNILQCSVVYLITIALENYRLYVYRRVLTKTLSHLCNINLSDKVFQMSLYISHSTANQSNHLQMQIKIIKIKLRRY